MEKIISCFLTYISLTQQLLNYFYVGNIALYYLVLLTVFYRKALKAAGVSTLTSRADSLLVLLFE